MAVNMYRDTKIPVSEILRETHVSSSELYRELNAENVKLRGSTTWAREVLLSKEETVEVFNRLAKGETMYAISRKMGLERSTIYRAITEHILEDVKNGEDIRTWLK